MTDETKSQEPDAPKPGLVIHDSKSEWWVKASVIFLIVTLVCWGVIFAKLGRPSVIAHAAVAPTLGALTVAMMFWGLLTTVFRPPALQKPRVAGFAMLLFVGFINNSPIVIPPLSTTDWESPQATLPLAGEVYVSAGGEDSSRNYHATTAAYRWAIDFSKLEDGKRFRLDGKKNEDYPCFNQPVVAPLGGKIIEQVNDIADNTPGEITPDFDNAFGNHVIIEHAPDVFVFVAHLKRDSVTVAIGDVIEQGDTIAACGNSGRTLEPHVHVHAQNTTAFPYSESLPLRYRYVSVSENDSDENGMPSGESEWHEGDGRIVRSD